MDLSHLKTILPVACFLFFGCASEQKKVENIAENFLEAYYVSFDFDACSELSTPSSKSKIEGKKNSVSLNPLAKNDPPKLSIKNIHIADNSSMALCNYEINSVQQSLALLKIDGEWLVDAVSSELDAFSSFGGGSGGFAVATSVPRSKQKKAVKDTLGKN